MNEEGRNPTTSPRTVIAVVVPQLERTVGKWREKYDATGFPAHVTVASPFLPRDAVTEDVVARLTTICAAAPVMRVAFRSVKRLSDGIVYIDPEPADCFTDLTAAILAEWPDAPVKRVNPHLTVARSIDREIMAVVDRDVSHSLPVEAALREAVLAAYDGERWQTIARLPFGGGADATNTRSRNLILLDAGGVIFNHEHGLSVTDAFNPIAAESRWRYDDILQLFRTRLQGPLYSGEHEEDWFWREIAAATGVRVKPEWATIVRQSIAEKITPETLSALSRLAQSGPVWVLSNQYEPWLMDGLALSGADRFLARVFVSSRIKVRKPERRAFDCVLDAWDGDAADILFVDDARDNIRVAEEVGMSTCLAKNDTRLWSREAEAFRERSQSMGGRCRPRPGLREAAT